MLSSNIGRLIRTTKDICSECGEAHLQIRGIQKEITVKGEQIREEKLFLRCPKCDGEFDYIDKKLNKSKHREIKEIKEPKEVKTYGRHNERPTTKRSFNGSTKRSY